MAAVVETHVSYLVFLDDVVLKYKKPVRFPFLDFTTAAARRDACEAEVRANGRLSPDVYLGVADVVLDGTALDHAVVMRRLPAQRSLAALVGAHAPDLDAQLHRVAAVLADFHSRAGRSSAIDAAGRPAAIERLWAGCAQALAASCPALLDAGAVARLDALARRYLAGRGPLLDERVGAGRVCDGHGDLLAGDVFLLEDGPRILDCVEFDPELRHVDVLADVTFLAMDLERLGAPAAAATFLRAYEEAAGERFPPTLVHWYCAQRAAVRAEVACLKAAQGLGAGEPGEEPAALVELALAHLEAGRVVLCAVAGLPASGKSTVARGIAERTGWSVLRSDEIRRELVDPGATGALEDEVGRGAYAPEVTERTYRTMLARAQVALERGEPVVLDATFVDPAWRRQVEELAGRTHSDLVVLWCEIDAELARRRLSARRAEGSDVSGADEDVLRAMAALAQPWDAAVVLDTAGPAPTPAVDAAVRALGSPVCEPAGRPRSP